MEDWDIVQVVQAYADGAERSKPQASMALELTPKRPT
jgi:hypothetical protein